MAKALLPDDLWALIQPLLPAYRPSPKGGRPRIDDRADLTGILFVLKTGLPWEYLPRELGCGSGMSCWRRLHAWQQAGSWQRIHDAMLQHLREYDQIQWERASVDSASVPSPPPRRTAYRRQSHRPRQARLQALSARRSTRSASGGEHIRGSGT
jgi:transposase